MRAPNWLKYNGFYLVVMAGICASFTFRPGQDTVKNSACQEIDIMVEGMRRESGGSIKIDFKQSEPSRLMVSIIGPKKFYIKDSRETEIKNLAKGMYSVVVVGREESYNYCPRHFTIDIK
jgi:hypothetical protein